MCESVSAAVLSVVWLPFAGNHQSFREAETALAFFSCEVDEEAMTKSLSNRDEPP
jgi:hypothetical protein